MNGCFFVIQRGLPVRLNVECFFTFRASARDHRVLQPRWPVELPSPEGRDVRELCHEYSRRHGELQRIQECQHSEAVHQKVHPQNLKTNDDHEENNQHLLFLMVMMMISVTVGSPAQTLQAPTWRWDPASRQIWRHLKVRSVFDPVCA